MILKPVLYLVAAIFLCAGVYAFIQYVPISYERVPYSVETDGPLKKAIDKKSTVLCDVESFWSKYNIWGDTDAVYGPPENDEAAKMKTDESVSCVESIENGVGQ